MDGLYVTLIAMHPQGTELAEFGITTDRERAIEKARNVDGVVVLVPVTCIRDFRKDDR